MTRPIKYVVGDVSKDGHVIHANVSIMTNDQGRLAVFNGKGKNPPVAVYDLADVTFRVTGNCSACKGYPPKTTMFKIWDQTERSAAATREAEAMAEDEAMHAWDQTERAASAS